MELTSLIAKDLEKLITRTKCDPQKTLSKLEFYKERKRITVEEYNYLVDLMEKKVQEDTEEQLAKK